MVFHMVDGEADEHAAELADDRRQRRARDAHRRAPEQAEDHDRVENDVDDRTRHLAAHLVHGLARHLKQALHRNLHEQAQRKDGTDQHVLLAHFGNFGVPGHRGEQRFRADDAENGECHEAQDRDEDAVLCDALGLLVILFAQTARQQRVDTDRRADGDRDHQVLHREHKAHGRERVLAEHGYENTVYNII